MRLEDLRPKTRKAAEQQRHKMQKRLSSGEKKNRKRMAEVVAVYTVAPFVRRPEEIVRELYSEDDPGTRPARPRPEKKRIWASVEKDMEPVLWSSFAEAQQRDPEHKKT